MKKLVFTTLAIACFSAISFAQAPAKEVPAAAPARAEMSKEEKKAMRAKQESDVQEALMGAGLTPDQVKTANEILAESSKKSKELKDNATLTPEAKETAKKALGDEKNAKLKALMGDEKYKAYNAIKKKQKEAMKDAKSAQ